MNALGKNAKAPTRLERNVQRMFRRLEAADYNGRLYMHKGQAVGSAHTNLGHALMQAVVNQPSRVTASGVVVINKRANR